MAVQEDDLEPRALIKEAEDRVKELSSTPGAVSNLPQECDFDLLKKWLLSVRRRMLASVIAEVQAPMSSHQVRGIATLLCIC